MGRGEPGSVVEWSVEGRQREWGMAIEGEGFPGRPVSVGRPAPILRWVRWVFPEELGEWFGMCSIQAAAGAIARAKELEWESRLTGWLVSTAFHTWVWIMG